MPIDWVIIGGFVCGALAGGASRYGRLCTMSAIEDALAGRDYRGAKAWGLAAGVAVALTQILSSLGWVDLEGSVYSGSTVHILGALLGGLLFGIGMTLVGTCAFGLLVRSGSGDLRAAMAAAAVGVVAMSATAGAVARLRQPLLGFGVIDLQSWTMPSIGDLSSGSWRAVAAAMVFGACAALALGALLDERMRRRPRLLLAAVGMGTAVALGWVVTSSAVANLALDRPQSLSFVAPVGRALLQFMMEPFRDLGFGVATALGVVVASTAVALWRRELRWEAFDDPVEMRRHLVGAAFMGLGGVLAQGCTIGQGMSALSTLALSAPLFIVAVLAGAKIGLVHLIEGRSLWRLGR